MQTHLAGMCQRLLTHFCFRCNDPARVTSKAHLQFQGNQTRIGVRKSNLFFLFSLPLCLVWSHWLTGDGVQRLRTLHSDQSSWGNTTSRTGTRGLCGQKPSGNSQLKMAAPSHAQAAPGAWSFRAERSRENSAGPAHPPRGL